MDNRVNFTSNINFVTGRAFNKVVRRCHTYIPFEPYEKDTFYAVANTFFTKDVRTCSAGGFTDGVNFSLGYHVLENDKQNMSMDKITQIIKNKLPDRPLRGLLIGSKDFQWNKIPKEIFEKMKLFMLNEAEHLTIFGEHSDKSAESNLHYNLYNDTWTINTKILNRQNECYYDVQTIYDLLKTFNDIHIANGDVLMISGKKIEL